MAAQTLPKTNALTQRKTNALTKPKIDDLRKIPVEGEEDLELDLGFDPTCPSLESTAAAGHPFALPWSREVRAILAGLDSEHLKEPASPWVLESPFDLRLAQLIAVIPDSIRDGTNGLSTAGHYRDGLSTSSESSREHLSAALGVTVGYPFLNASASAKYDRQIAEDKNGIKASRNASCRAGRVILDRTPVLSQAALNILRSGRGAEKRFWQRYGDFYICGFVLGADAGACMSASTESRSSQESLEITVQVKTFFFEASATHAESKTERSASSSFAFSGYSTLDGGQPCALALASGSSAHDQRVLQLGATAYLDKIKGLPQQVRKVMQEAGLVDGGSLALADCTRLCRSGLVAELLLAPFARLNQYVECVGQQNTGPIVN